MTDSGWKRVWELYQQAAALSPAEAQALLDAAPDPPEIVAEAKQILASTGSTAPPTSYTGQIIGRYQVLEQIGRGGSGDVYAGRDTQLGREVALKFLHPWQVGSEWMQSRFLREAQMASSLNHPYIVTIFEVMAGPPPLIVMERVTGDSLRQLCRTPVPEPTLIRIGTQIAQALAAAHAQSIVHRDLKPENVVVRHDGYAKILDFGLARVALPAETSISSMTGVGAGTLRYMSPEQCKGEAATAASDIFALGMLLFEMANAIHPFDAPTPLETAHAILHRAPSAFRTPVSGSLRQLILDMLAKEPATRPAAADVAARFPRFGRPQEPTPTPSRRQWLIGGAAAAAIAGGSVPLWRWPRNPGDQVLLRDGLIIDPSVSPDRRWLAFVWRPPGSRNGRLHVMPTAGGTPVAVTNTSAEESEPAWSPDSKQLVFLRRGAGENAIYIVPWTGAGPGPERRIHSLNLFGSPTWLSSQELVICDNFDGPMMHLARFHLGRGFRQTLSHPKDGASDYLPRLSPDGQWLAFTRFFTMTTSDLFVVPVNGGEERRLTHDEQAKRELRWAPDGKGVLYRSRGKRWALRYVPFAGGPAREVSLPFTPYGNFEVLPAAAGEVRLIAANTYSTESVWRAEIPIHETELAKPQRFISSAQGDVNVNPAISPDGLKVAFVSTRSGSPEIWVTDSEGNRPLQLTFFAGPELAPPAWSPDSASVMSSVSVRAGDPVFVVPAAGGPPRWLPIPVAVWQPQFSSNGTSVTYSIHNSTGVEVWRYPLAGGRPQLLSRANSAVHKPSPDGEWIYFTRQREPGLFRFPAQGGTPELVLDRVAVELYRGWAVGRQGIYYTIREESGKWLVQLYDPASKSHRPICRLDLPLPRWTGALSVSPDERWMVFPLHEPEGSTLSITAPIRLP
ncbi:MAG: serine/threonine-protein kinase [Bryobacterales bacterium]|nr:serine/threonine-protein kinase [Bryobacterales bacterium]